MESEADGRTHLARPSRFNASATASPLIMPASGLGNEPCCNVRKDETNNNNNNQQRQQKQKQQQQQHICHRYLSNSFGRCIMQPLPNGRGRLPEQKVKIKHEAERRCIQTSS
jgi:hypothetical protein